MSIYASRKRNRLEGDLYRQPGAYFITICTEGKKNLFWQEAPINPSSEHSLSTMGRIADEEILETVSGYGAFMDVDQHVVMPNHVHMLITMEMPQSCACPDIRYVVRLYKRRVSQRAGRSIWQKGFYDHIVRSEPEYREIWKYIDENPVKWQIDRYYFNEIDHGEGDEGIAPTVVSPSLTPTSKEAPPCH